MHYFTHGLMFLQAKKASFYAPEVSQPTQGRHVSFSSGWVVYIRRACFIDGSPSANCQLF
jgi:hypothetical protein